MDNHKRNQSAWRRTQWSKLDLRQIEWRVKLKNGKELNVPDRGKEEGVAVPGHREERSWPRKSTCSRGRGGWRCGGRSSLEEEVGGRGRKEGEGRKQERITREGSSRRRGTTGAEEAVGTVRWISHGPYNFWCRGPMTCWREVGLFSIYRNVPGSCMYKSRFDWWKSRNQTWTRLVGLCQVAVWAHQTFTTWSNRLAGLGSSQEKKVGRVRSYIIFL